MIKILIKINKLTLKNYSCLILSKINKINYKDIDIKQIKHIKKNMGVILKKINNGEELNEQENKLCEETLKKEVFSFDCNFYDKILQNYNKNKESYINIRDIYLLTSTIIFVSFVISGIMHMLFGYNYDDDDYVGLNLNIRTIIKYGLYFSFLAPFTILYYIYQEW